MNDFVYVIRFGDHDHKIGVSIYPDKRLWQVGGERVCRTWRHDHFSAYAIEGAVHRMLKDRRIMGVPTVERFRVTEEAACMAVEMAIILLEGDRAARVAMDAELEAERRDAALHQALLAARPQTMEPQPPAAAPERGQPVHIGYIRAPSTDAIRADLDLLIAAGVSPRRIYSDHGLEPGPGFDAAVRACRSGDSLVVARAECASPDAAETLARRGASIVRAAA